MNNQEYHDWLDALTVGDKLAVRHVYGSTTLYRVATVEKITPTRQIKVSGDNTKFKNGEQIGNNTSWMHSYYIEPITDDVRDWIAREKLIAKLSKINYREMGTDKLRKIVEILEAVE